MISCEYDVPCNKGLQRACLKQFVSTRTSFLSCHHQFWSTQNGQEVFRKTEEICEESLFSLCQFTTTCTTVSITFFLLAFTCMTVLCVFLATDAANITVMAVATTGFSLLLSADAIECNQLSSTKGKRKCVAGP